MRLYRVCKKLMGMIGAYGQVVNHGYEHKNYAWPRPTEDYSKVKDD
ncbi:MAG: hypothetical protein WCJ97_00930 [Phycisphaerae bacterium]